MYDQKYVKKRRRRKIAAFIALFTSIAATALIIVSYLGRTVGTFTVAVTNSSVKLALSKTVDLKETTSHLRVDKLYPMRETTFTNFEGQLAEIDSETTDYDYGFNYKEGATEPDSMYFIKYTFYVTNLSETIAKYNVSVKLEDRNMSTDGTKRNLDDTLRVILFENDPINDDGHKYTVYAKESAEYNFDKDGNKTRREFVSTYGVGNQEDEEHPLAETFLPGQAIVKSTVSNFKKGDIRRYTLVMWLEGEDPQSDNSKEIPEGASLKFGVDVAAYENE